MAVGSRFARYINPILQALGDLGGSARPGEVLDEVARSLHISEQERTEKHRTGNSKFENDVHWARFYLARSGYLDSSRRGVWSLTDLGRNAGVLSDDTIEDVVRNVQASSIGTEEFNLATVEETDSAKIAAARAEASAPEEVARGYRERTLEIMQTLPAQGFERLCQRLLRESGFQQVKVTGRSGDGGIDGIGILQVNAFVSFKVLFQCKRWVAPVGPSVVRDFRGAMMGRADKGLVLTTGSFTTDAQAEAVRDGASPIELIDGQSIVTLLEDLELGLIQRKTYEVDEKFFEEFLK